MTCWSLQEQRAFNTRRSAIWRLKAFAIPLIAVVSLTAAAQPRLERHKGEFGPDFNQDFDVDYAALKLRGGFELRAGGGSLNFVSDRPDFAIELFRFPAAPLLLATECSDGSESSSSGRARAATTAARPTAATHRVFSGFQGGPTGGNPVSGT